MPDDTETKWCNVGKHQVPSDGFAKGQHTCRVCRQRYRRNNYRAGRTCCDCGTPVVNRALRCQPCYQIHRRATATPSRSLTVRGYVILGGLYEHPNANKRGQVLEHVKVMGDILGRPIRPGENVHHINGIKDDNRPENLELWTSSQPPGQRVADLVDWALEILSRYEPEMAQHRRSA